MTEYCDRYKAFMGLAPKKIPYWEHWSCPDAETYLTGIDYYDHPQQCRQKLQELYPQLGLPVPSTDDSVPHPNFDENESSSVGEDGGHRIRWGAGESWVWNWGRKFKTAEDVFAFSPMEHTDFRNTPVVESRDYSDEENLFLAYRQGYPAEHGERAPGSVHLGTEPHDVVVRQVAVGQHTLVGFVLRN